MAVLLKASKSGENFEIKAETKVGILADILSLANKLLLLDTENKIQKAIIHQYEEVAIEHVTHDKAENLKASKARTTTKENISKGWKDKGV
jgi:ABC-type iron transport system FetAB ATPase subunit